MANRDLYPARATCPEQVSVAFSFAPNSTSAVDQTSIKGLAAVTSVTRTAAGVFDVLFKDAYNDLVAFVPCVSLVTDADVTISSYKWVVATKTLTINVRSGGSAADLAASAYNRVGGVAFFKNTQLSY